MSWGEDEYDDGMPVVIYKCPVCEEKTRCFYKKHNMCWGCYNRTPEGKRRKAISEAYHKREKEYHALKREFEGEIQRDKEREERKKRYEKLKREFKNK